MIITLRKELLVKPLAKYLINRIKFVITKTCWSAEEKTPLSCPCPLSIPNMWPIWISSESNCLETPVWQDFY